MLNTCTHVVSFGCCTAHGAAISVLPGCHTRFHSTQPTFSFNNQLSLEAVYVLWLVENYC